MSDSILKIDLTPNLNDNKNQIKRVHHISDIHINLRARHDEYNEVFQNLNQFLINEKNKYKIPINQNKNIECLVVITGDILHSKTELLPECIEVTRNFITNISKLMPVVLMAGNHDLNINNNDRLDALTPIINGIDKDFPVYYLKKTGVYKFHNVLWSLSSVQDYQIINPNNFNFNDFQINHNYENTYKICMFHGRVNGAILFNNSKLDGETNKKNNKTITPSSFEGYDYTLLGDIHKFQYLNTNTSKKRMAYSGSLIQQNHGESLNNHGVLKWDIQNSKSTFHEISNNYGFVSYTIKKNYNQESLELEITNLIKIYPYNIRLRIFYEDISSLQLQEIVSVFKISFNVLEVVYSDVSQNDNNIEKELTLKTSDVNFQNKLIESYLLQSTNANKKTIELVKIINKTLNETLQENTFHLNTKWSIHKLEFSNLFSYAENNVINFKRYKGILGIIAPNHMGKSSIIDIILFTLFDKFPRKGNIKDIINNRKNTFKSKISLIIGKWKYVIEKTGVKNTKSRVTCKLNFYKINKDNLKQSLNEDTQSKTKDAILKYIGCYEDIIQTSVSLQNNNCNFIEAENTARKRELERILQINFIEELLKKATSDINSKRAVYKHLQSNCYVESIVNLQTNIKENTARLNELHNSEVTLKQQLEEFDSISSKLREEIIPNIDDKLADINQKMETTCHPTQLIKELNYKIIKYENDLNEIMLKGKYKTISLDNLNSLKKEKEIEFTKFKSELQDKIRILECNIESEYKKIKSFKYEKYSVSDNSTINLSIIESNQTKIEKETKKNKKNLEIILVKINNLENLKSKLNQNNQLILELNQKLNKLNLDELPDKLIEILEETNCVKLKDKYEDDSKYIQSLLNKTKKLKQNKTKFDYNDFIENCKTLHNYEYIEHYHTLNEQNNLEKVQRVKEIKGLKNNNNDIEKQIKLIKRNQLELDKSISEKKINENNLELEYLEYDKLIINNNKTSYDLINKYKVEKNKLEDKINSCCEWKKFQNKYENVLKKYELTNKLNTLKNKCDLIQNNMKTYLELEESKIKNEAKHTDLKKTLNSINDIKNKLKNNDSELNVVKATFISNNTKLSEHKKEVKKMEDIEKELNIYLLYQNALKNLPFIIIKKIVPRIEKKINDLLSVCTNFMIKIIIENNKIDIYIDRPVYNGELILLNNASGFEKFISSLAIRIALIEVSQLPKPTFIAIDEGWSSFDYQNINNARVIFDFLNSKFNLVISISHLPQIKEHCNEQINLKKDENGYSKII